MLTDLWEAVLSDGDDDPVVPAGDTGRVPLPVHHNHLKFISICLWLQVPEVKLNYCILL